MTVMTAVIWVTTTMLLVCDDKGDRRLTYRGEWNYAKRCWGGYCGGYGYRNDGAGLGDNLKIGNLASNNAGDAGMSSTSLLLNMP